MLDTCNHNTCNAANLIFKYKIFLNIKYFAALNLIFYGIFVTHFNQADILQSRPIIIVLKYREITFKIN